ncbi:MAG: RlmF-related methyltransferase [Candidatus Jordarchaeum sp.]|uniref:RlmF-related methyltransferase n=1 Tax=Candidatus Jordarchaeum sp. TaxID=2823881 RepID=UPI00404B1699
MKTVKVEEGLPISQILQKYPELVTPYLKKLDPPKLDFKNKRALAIYNKIIAREVLGIELSFPFKGLIPAVMSRFEFVKMAVKPQESVLDIGTGSSAVCAIIAAKHLMAEVYATEMIDEYYESAKRNILENSLHERIHLIKSSGEIIEGVIPKNLNFDAIISNPPYLPSKTTLSDKKFGGSAAELIGGGKTGAEFSLKIIREGVPRLNPGGRIGLIFPIKTKKIYEIIISQMKKEKLNVEIIRLITGNRERLIIIGSKN